MCITYGIENRKLKVQNFIAGSEAYDISCTKNVD